MDTHSIELLKKWKRRKSEAEARRDYYMSTTSTGKRSYRFCVHMEWRAADRYAAFEGGDFRVYGETAAVAVRRALKKAAILGVE